MNILVVAPHADDEILGVGGTIARYVKQNNDVYICIVTSGHPSMFPAEMLKKLRNEAIEAHSFLGVKETVFLDFPAVKLNEVPVHQLNSAILEVVRKVKPDIAYIPHGGDIHIDHKIVAQSAMVALRPVDGCKVREIYSYETLSESEWNIQHAGNVFIPNTWVDISDFLDVKLKAMSIYSTQVKEFPHPRSLKAIETLAILRGSTVGMQAAEAFNQIRRIV